MRRQAAGVLLGFVLMPALCPASYISLQFESRADISNDLVSLTVGIANHGDEPACSVQAEVSFGETSCWSEAVAEIRAGSSTNLTLPLGPLPEPKGSYAAVLKVRYQDGNGYPFSALSVIPLAAELDVGTSDLTIHLTSAKLMEEGTLRLDMASTAEESLDVGVRLVLPDELKSDRPVIRVPISMEKAVSLDLPIRNASARPASSYPIFAVAEYRLKGRPQAVTASALVEVIGSGRLSRLQVRLGEVAIMVLLAVFLAVQFIAQSRHDRESGGPQ